MVQSNAQSRANYSLLLWKKLFCIFYLVPHKCWDFPVWFEGTGIISGPAYSNVPSHPAQEISSYVSVFEYSAEYSKGPLQNSSVLSLCTLTSLVCYPVNSNCLRLPILQPTTPKFRKFTIFYLVSYTLHHSLEILSQFSKQGNQS